MARRPFDLLDPLEDELELLDELLAEDDPDERVADTEEILVYDELFCLLDEVLPELRYTFRFVPDV